MQQSSLRRLVNVFRDDTAALYGQNKCRLSVAASDILFYCMLISYIGNSGYGTLHGQVVYKWLLGGLSFWHLLL
jgi:hypothetical protein